MAIIKNEIIERPPTSYRHVQYKMYKDPNRLAARRQRALVLYYKDYPSNGVKKDLRRIAYARYGGLKDDGTRWVGDIYKETVYSLLAYNFIKLPGSFKLGESNKLGDLINNVINSGENRLLSFKFNSWYNLNEDSSKKIKVEVDVIDELGNIMNNVELLPNDKAVPDVEDLWNPDWNHLPKPKYGKLKIRLRISGLETYVYYEQQPATDYWVYKINFTPNACYHIAYPNKEVITNSGIPNYIEILPVPKAQLWFYFHCLIERTQYDQNGNPIGDSHMVTHYGTMNKIVNPEIVDPLNHTLYYPSGNDQGGYIQISEAFPATTLTDKVEIFKFLYVDIKLTNGEIIEGIKLPLPIKIIRLANECKLETYPWLRVISITGNGILENPKYPENNDDYVSNKHIDLKVTPLNGIYTVNAESKSKGKKVWTSGVEKPMKEVDIECTVEVVDRASPPTNFCSVDTGNKPLKGNFNFTIITKDNTNDNLDREAEVILQAKVLQSLDPAGSYNITVSQSKNQPLPNTKPELILEKNTIKPYFKVFKNQYEWTYENTLIIPAYGGEVYLVLYARATLYTPMIVGVKEEKVDSYFDVPCNVNSIDISILPDSIDYHSFKFENTNYITINAMPPKGRVLELAFVIKKISDGNINGLVWEGSERDAENPFLYITQEENLLIIPKPGDLYYSDKFKPKDILEFIEPNLKITSIEQSYTYTIHSCYREYGYYASETYTYPTPIHNSDKVANVTKILKEGVGSVSKITQSPSLAFHYNFNYNSETNLGSTVRYIKLTAVNNRNILTSITIELDSVSLKDLIITFDSKSTRLECEAIEANGLRGNIYLYTKVTVVALYADKSEKPLVTNQETTLTISDILGISLANGALVNYSGITAYAYANDLEDNPTPWTDVYKINQISGIYLYSYENITKSETLTYIPKKSEKFILQRPNNEYIIDGTLSFTIEYSDYNLKTVYNTSAESLSLTIGIDSIMTALYEYSSNYLDPYTGDYVVKSKYVGFYTDLDLSAPEGLTVSHGTYFLYIDVDQNTTTDARSFSVWAYNGNETINWINTPIVINLEGQTQYTEYSFEDFRFDYSGNGANGYAAAGGSWSNRTVNMYLYATVIEIVRPENTRTPHYNTLLPETSFIGNGLSYPGLVESVYTDYLVAKDLGTTPINERAIYTITGATGTYNGYTYETNGLRTDIYLEANIKSEKHKGFSIKTNSASTISDISPDGDTFKITITSLETYEEVWTSGAPGNTGSKVIDYSYSITPNAGVKVTKEGTLLTVSIAENPNNTARSFVLTVSNGSETSITFNLLKGYTIIKSLSFRNITVDATKASASRGYSYVTVKGDVYIDLTKEGFSEPFKSEFLGNYKLTKLSISGTSQDSNHAYEYNNDIWVESLGSNRTTSDTLVFTITSVSFSFTLNSISGNGSSYVNCKVFQESNNFKGTPNKQLQFSITCDNQPISRTQHTEAINVSCYNNISGTLASGSTYNGTEDVKATYSTDRGSLSPTSYTGSGTINLNAQENTLESTLIYNISGSCKYGNTSAKIEQVGNDYVFKLGGLVPSLTYTDGITSVPLISTKNGIIHNNIMSVSIIRRDNYVINPPELTYTGSYVNLSLGTVMLDFSYKANDSNKDIYFDVTAIQGTSNKEVKFTLIQSKKPIPKKEEPANPSGFLYNEGNGLYCNVSFTAFGEYPGGNINKAYLLLFKETNVVELPTQIPINDKQSFYVPSNLIIRFNNVYIGDNRFLVYTKILICYEYTNSAGITKYVYSAELLKPQN